VIFEGGQTHAIMSSESVAGELSQRDSAAPLCRTPEHIIYPAIEPPFAFRSGFYAKETNHQHNQYAPRNHPFTSAARKNAGVHQHSRLPGTAALSSPSRLSELRELKVMKIARSRFPTHAHNGRVESEPNNLGLHSANRSYGRPGAEALRPWSPLCSPARTMYLRYKSEKKPRSVSSWRRKGFARPSRPACGRC